MRNRRRFQKIEVKGYIAVTQSGSLIASTIRPHPEGDFPTVYVKSESVPAGAIARQVRVTVELCKGASPTPDQGAQAGTGLTEKGDQGAQSGTGSQEKS